MKMRIHCCCALLCAAFFFNTVTAQSAYSLHKLEEGETLSTLAKNYHTTVGDIMRLNGMNAQSKLQPGEQVKIPAGGVVVPAQKPVVTSTPAATQAPVASGTPKTHVVAAGETLFRISQTYHIPVDQLKTVNNLSDGGLKVGQTLLLTNDASSAQPAKPKTEPVVTTPKETPVQAQPKVAQATPARQTTAASAPAQKKQDNTPAQTANLSKQEVIVQDNSNAFDANYSASSNAPKEGFFTSLYGKDANSKDREQIKDGSAMTFKSASGWADKKYYILMNDAPTGSIVKIKNGRNELYAKVLWNLSEMKENEGLAFRISTAAAAALGVTDQKFDLKVSYYE